MNDDLIQRLHEFLDRLTDEERQDLYVVLRYACEIIGSQRKDT